MHNTTECLNGINEIIVDGNRIYTEDGEVKTVFNERIQQNNGDMSVEDLREILKAEIVMIYSNEITEYND